MQKVRVHAFGLSLDGYGAGPAQGLEQPLGLDGQRIFEWFFVTRTFRAMQGQDDGETGLDDRFAAAGFDNVGAWILGRNMFGPVRGPWPDDSWKGWWGDTPPFHVPVFVLTNHPRASFAMDGGTNFHFITGGIHEALDRAREAAGSKDVRIGGGVSTLRQYFEAKLIDEAQFAVSPVLLGRGENLFAGLDLPALGYAVKSSTPGERTTHIEIARA